MFLPLKTQNFFRYNWHFILILFKTTGKWKNIFRPSLLQIFPKRVDFYLKTLYQQLKFFHYFLIFHLFCVFVSIFYGKHFHKPIFDFVLQQVPQNFSLIVTCIILETVITVFTKQFHHIFWKDQKQSRHDVFFFKVYTGSLYISKGDLFLLFLFHLWKIFSSSLTKRTKIVFFQQ